MLKIENHTRNISVLVSVFASEDAFEMGVILYLILGVIALAYYLIKKRYSYWTDRGFVSPSSRFPFGHLEGVGISTTIAEKMNVIYKDNKGKAPAVGLYFFLSPAILPIDPELCKNILVRDFSSFHDRGLYYNKEDDPMSAK